MLPRIISKIISCSGTVALCALHILPGTSLQAQGCSDAGFCTVGSIKAGPVPDTSSQHQISLISTHGQGDDGVYVMTNTLQYDWQWSKHWSVQGRLLTNYANGNLGSVAGLGDVIVAFSYHHPVSAKWQMSYTAGIKVPLQQANASEDGRPLPMQYQPSLGTTDVVLGVALQSQRWHLAAGWQQPLTRQNKNGFLPQYWPNTEAAANYPPSNRLQRKADMLARASYNLVASRKIHWSGGLLAIIHLANDAYTDPFVQPSTIVLDGSSGLTLNATSQVQWQISRQWRLGLTAAIPVSVRGVRPDGLTRSWVLAPEIAFRF